MKSLYTIKTRHWDFQLILPEIRLRKKELYLNFATVLRVVNSTESRGIGISLLGFGFAVVYYSKEG